MNLLPRPSYYTHEFHSAGKETVNDIICNGVIFPKSENMNYSLEGGFSQHLESGLIFCFDNFEKLRSYAKPFLYMVPGTNEYSSFYIESRIKLVSECEIRSKKPLELNDIKKILVLNNNLSESQKLLLNALIEVSGDYNIEIISKFPETEYLKWYNENIHSSLLEDLPYRISESEGVNLDNIMFTINKYNLMVCDLFDIKKDYSSYLTDLKNEMYEYIQKKENILSNFELNYLEKSILFCDIGLSLD